MEENVQHFWHIMLYYFKEGKKATEMQKQDLYSVWRRCCDWICQKWFAKFHAGDFSLGNAPQLSRPVEVDSNQIETLIENNQSSTMQEITNILKNI